MTHSAEQMYEEFCENNEDVYVWECTCGAEGYAAINKFPCPECGKELWLL